MNDSGIKKEIRQLAKEELHEIAPLFAGWEETLIYSCLQGCMGRAYVCAGEKAWTAAGILLGDFCFLGGEPKEGLVREVPRQHLREFLLLVPQNREWERMIEQTYGEKAWKYTRYAIKKEPDVFEREKLQGFVDALPAGYELRWIDRELYSAVMQEEWSRDLCSVFDGYADYAARGLGVVALMQGRVAAGASSYAVYESGIEIEIDTEESHRRRGLALACGARLILGCLDRGLYPSWDAHDLRSVQLAEKLGYHRDKEYTTYVVRGYNPEEHA